MSFNLRNRSLLKVLEAAPKLIMELAGHLFACGKTTRALEKQLFDFLNAVGKVLENDPSGQERAIQHFPADWMRENLPGMRRLRRHGLSFETACTAACMCSPSRSSLMTGYFPAQHGVKYTLEENMPATEYPQVDLPTGLPNLGTVMRAAGYHVAYKGKWHCSKPATPHEAVPADLELQDDRHPRVALAHQLAHPVAHPFDPAVQGVRHGIQ